ncbi:hypothetical protein [Streptomyces mirabilis]|uniref:hypothetical protein n=1 Tax=Streptomyces mirabilis TaxID=68239 RepID=UPI00369D0DE5
MPVLATIPALGEVGAPVREDIAAFGDAQPAGAPDQLRRLMRGGPGKRGWHRAEDKVGAIPSLGRVLPQLGDVTGGRGVTAAADLPGEVPAQLGGL